MSRRRYVHSQVSYDLDDYLQLSGIQHFSFCRRQWALIHVEQQWSENLLTTEGRILHERVHDSALVESRGDTLVMRALAVKSSDLGISGQCDAVVFIRSAEGVVLRGRKGRWAVMPIEYKHGHSKLSDCDRLQVVAQSMCLEEMLCCTIHTAAVYYFETRKREYIKITDDLRQTVREICAEMHEYARRGYTPKVRPTAHCKQCSLYEQCYPVLLRSDICARAYVQAHIKEVDE
jgi:CRISPR-associated exonuclease Cas4